MKTEYTEREKFRGSVIFVFNTDATNPNNNNKIHNLLHDSNVTNLSFTRFILLFYHNSK